MVKNQVSNASFYRINTRSAYAPVKINAKLGDDLHIQTHRSLAS